MHRRIPASMEADALGAAGDELLKMAPQDRVLGDGLVALFRRALKMHCDRINWIQRRDHTRRMPSQVPDNGLSPEEIVAANQFVEQLFDEVAGSELRDAEQVLRAAAWGKTPDELAKAMGFSGRTARRRFQHLREIVQRKVKGPKRGLPPRISFSGMVGEATPTYSGLGEIMATHRGHRLELRLERQAGVVRARAHCAYARHIGIFYFVAGDIHFGEYFVQGEDEDITEHAIALPDDVERVIGVATSSLTLPAAYRGLSDSHARFWLMVGAALRDAIREGWTVQQIEDELSGNWEVSEASAHRVRPDHIRRGGEVPSPSDELRRMLKKAASYGRRSEFAAAAAAYREIWTFGYERSDTSAMVSGGVGLFMSLRYLGFFDSADRVLLQLLNDVALDAKWASRISRELCSMHLDYDRPVEARRWLEQTSAEEHPPDAADYHQRMARLLFGEDRRDEAIAYIDSHADFIQSLRQGRRRLLATERILCEWRVFVSATSGDALKADYLDLRAMYAQTRVEHRGTRWIRTIAKAGRLLGHSAREMRLVEEATAQLSLKDDRLLDHWQQHDLIRAVEEIDDQIYQVDFWRRLWLHSKVATSDRPLLAAARGVHNVMWSSPMETFLKMDSLPEADHVEELIVSGGRELRQDRCDRSCRELGEFLFPEPITGDVLVASDGLLTEAPLYAAHWAAHPGEPLPAFREVLGPRRVYEAQEPAPTIASLADPHGDLPGAHAEVDRERADVWLRGAEVTRQALAESKAGLLILGVHTRGGSDGRFLDLADGPVYAEQLALMDFEGAVVYLSGCSTASQQTLRGVELSFASAILQAGARGVVGYRWSVRDEDARRATEVLLESWPSPNPATWVRDAVQTLIDEGAPEHVWGALHLY
ncbi:MAG: CHAT domain-containing protein [Myxococcota bacterium]